ncbi:nuclear receptor coactivator 4 isoform 2-T3 [Polymixia lowei]
MRMSCVEVEEPAGLRQCQQARAQLEEAVSGVMRAESLLRDSSREVRSELHSCISRQQESLRCREVWLLGQINLLEQLKAETLQNQLQQLYWLKGQFDVIVHQLENSNSSYDLNNQLTSCLDKLSSLNLTPEENPDMSFQADTRSLRQAITSFGRIATQNMEDVPPLSPAPQKAWLQQSCPVAAKKQKMEAGPLADWLLGTHPITSAPVGYQSSKNPQDWLMSHKEAQLSHPALAPFDFYAAWGQLKDLEVWLLKEKTPAIRERANSNASTSSSTFSIEKIDESEFNMALEEEEEEEEEDDEESQDELSDWLITPTTVSMETVLDAERWKQVFEPFREPWSSNDWLPKPPSPPADCGSCCQSRSKAVEIENLGKLKCLKTPPTPSPASSPASIPSPSTLDMWLQQAVPVQQACRANEACSSYSQCVCEENCGREALGAWLLRQDGRDKNGVPVAKNSPPHGPSIKPAGPHQTEQQQKVQAILEAWLHPSKACSSSRSQAPPLDLDLSSLSAWVASPGEEKASREEHSSQFKTSSCISRESLFQGPLEPERWVVPEKTSTPGSGGQPQPEEDKWLLRKRSQAQERLALPTVCDLFSCMKIGGDKDKWLHKAPIQM